MKPQTQKGYIYEAFGAFHLRFYKMHFGVKKQFSKKLCNKTADTPSKDSPAVLALAEALMGEVNLHNTTKRKFTCNRTVQGKFAPKV
jgi:hypothetical protein